MSPKILADECVDFRIIRALRDRGFEVASILKQAPGLPDEEILDLAKVSQTLLLTEDSDFGRWVFAHKKKEVGVIFLRYAPDTVEKIVFALVHVLMTHQEALLQKFVVITPKKSGSEICSKAAYGGAAELTALQKFLPAAQDKEGVQTRVAWTIARLKER